ncbi:14931_t:CDS:2, partial [Gigaspora margarita]
MNKLVIVLKPGGFLELFDAGPADKRLWFTAAKLENIKKEIKQIYHDIKSNDIVLSKVAINNMTYLYESLKPTLTRALKISDDEYDELVKASKDELF